MHKKRNEELNNLRHSCAHLLAAAVLELWPGTKLGFGPPIEDGFYYDFDFQGSGIKNKKSRISEADLAKIERKMREIVKEWDKFEEIKKPIDIAKEMMEGQPYKQELIDEFAKDSDRVTFHKSGDFIDLCKGEHVDNPSEKLQHFKLLSIAGAYWRGDEKNPMLNRIYGTCFSTEDELVDYLKLREEAKKRDHKKLGRELNLFFFSDLVGAGLPIWTPKGTLIRNLLDDFVWELREKRGYEKVEIPHITKKELYEISGHWEKFKDELFKIRTREGHEFSMKPMNCPHHTQVYAHLPRSYRELPQRYANTTMVYRDEQSGELSGLARVRCITQDDAHVFCRKGQLKEEFLRIWEIVEEFYGAFGFKLRIRLSLHDPSTPEKYLGSEEEWRWAEEQLLKIVEEKKVTVSSAKGEAAFYGPKIDFMASDSLKREWQVATIQLDMNMPERFDLVCINEEGDKERIVMVHAAIMGAIERFLAIIIEHFAGAFPAWLHPVQVKILPVSDKFSDYSRQVFSLLMTNDSSLRVELDDSDETLGNKIRKAQEEKVPYMLIAGGKEEENETVNLRLRTEEEIGEISVDKFLAKTSEINSTRSLKLW